LAKNGRGSGGKNAGRKKEKLTGESFILFENIPFYGFSIRDLIGRIKFAFTMACTLWNTKSAKVAFKLNEVNELSLNESSITSYHVFR
jgi:hypothetical protein